MPDIFHEVFIEAEARVVYRALTTQPGLAGWWTPLAAADGEHVWRFPFGAGYYKSMEVQELMPDQLVKWTCVRAADEWVGTTLSFQLRSGDRAKLLAMHPEAAGQMEQSDTGCGTILSFRHAGWAAQTSMFAECSYTWGLFLRSLKLYCEMGSGLPWPNQHRVR